ncbi:hypothetical protein V8F20_006429 [Naviculisporaceae sp. PSN 640]
MKALQFSWLLSYLTVLTNALSLQDALQANGLSEFATKLQEVNPSLLSIPPGSSFIVYAPPNEAVTGNTTITRRAEDDDKNQTAQYQFMFANENAPVLGRRQAGGGSTTGSVFRTLLNDPEYVNLGPGKNQSVVQKGSVIFSGLGAKVNTLSADIPFDGGVIRPVDGFLTLPSTLSDTLPAIGLGVFKSALERTDLLQTLDETPDLTLLAPQNSALENTSCWWSDVKLTAAIKEQVLVDFPGYTPLLKNGASYSTLAGTRLTVVITDDGKISVGGAEILSGGNDVIVKNGVLHAVSGWATSSPPEQPSSTTAVVPSPTETPPPVEAAAVFNSKPTLHQLGFVVGFAAAVAAFGGF